MGLGMVFLGRTPRVETRGSEVPSVQGTQNRQAAASFLFFRPLDGGHLAASEFIPWRGYLHRGSNRQHFHDRRQQDRLRVGRGGDGGNVVQEVIADAEVGMVIRMVSNHPAQAESD